MTKSHKMKRLVGVRNLRKIMFTDEKIFTLQETTAHPQVKFHCRPCNRYCESLKCSLSTCQHSPGVMVWGGVSKLGRTPLIFVDPGTKVNSVYYQSVILKHYKMWCISALGGIDSVTLQQDWAPAHRAKSTKSWLRTNLVPFWDEDIYPAASPDLNPLDFSIWGWMQQSLRGLNLQTVDQLKVEVVRIWNSLPQNIIDRAIDQLPERLDMLQHANGNRFE
jgi:inhibitor of nuclear factor kappa-B kinase subunit alpha